MTRLINTFLMLIMCTVILVCSIGFTFETCYRYSIKIQFVFVLLNVYAMCMIVLAWVCNKLILYLGISDFITKTQLFHVMDSGTQVEELITKSRLNLYHSQFELENRRIQNEQRKNEQQKFVRVTCYTRNTFIRLGFTKSDVFKICESVEYLVCNNTVLQYDDLHINYNPKITQISLKNFAWNIANQYGLSRDLAAEFIMVTFREWFKNTTRTTVVKTLRTTLGTHDIP